MTRHLEEWSKEELIEALRSMQTGAAPPGDGAARDPGDAATLQLPDPRLHESRLLLEESRSRYADLYDLAPVAYVTLDREGRIIESNLEAASLFGWPRAELNGEPLTSVITIVERACFQAHLSRCFETGARGSVELTFVSWHGRVVVEMISMPIVARDGQVTACKTTLTDITAIKTSEERLRVLSETSEALVSSLDYSTTLVAVTRLIVPVLADFAFIDLREEDGRIARYSPRASRTFSLEPDAPQSCVLDAGQPLLMPTCSAETMRRAASDGQLEQARSRDGSLLLVPLTARDRTLGVMTCILSGSGRYHSAGDLALAQQVASRAAMAVDNARLYFAARRAIRAREDVAAIVSHDLRNPLQGIRLQCEQLLELPEAIGPSGRRHVESIQRGVNAMERLIRDLLDMARIEAGQLVIYPEQQQTTSLIADALNLVRPLAERKAIAIEVQTTANGRLLYCDRERILQVLSNLLGNAIKFTPARGKISLEVTADDARTSFYVRDTGDGIPPDHLPHLFERYWRANRSDTKGVGLGLYIAKAIVDAHGGEMTVDSQVGNGTTVRFTLPHALAPDAPCDGRATA